MTIHGVFFDVNTYLLMTNTPLTGAPSTPVGTMSFWFRSIPPLQFAYANENGYLTVLFGMQTGNNSVQFSAWATGADAGNFAQFQILLSASNAPQTAYSPFSVGVYTSDGKWHHCLVTWDSNHAAGSRLATYVVDRLYTFTDVRSYQDTGTAFALNYALLDRWQISDYGRPAGNLAEIWFAPGVSLNVTDPNVISKFVTSDDQPADLGTNGSIPTGTAPLLYLSARTAADDFLTNRGSGGGTFGYDASVNHLVFSSVDPSIELPLTRISGTDTHITMRSGYNGVTPADTSGSNLPANLNYLYPLLGGSGDITVSQTTPLFDATLVPSLASFAVLHDDGTYDLKEFGTTGDSTNRDYYVGRGSSAIYISVYDSSTPTLTMHIISLASMDVASHQFVIPSWLTENIANSRSPAQMASIIWWDGKEQCLAMIDNAPNGGNALMIDAAGNMTEARIWNGLTEGDCYNVRGTYAYVITLPDQANNLNYFLIVASQTGNGSTTVAVADTTGTELSRKIIHADNVEAEFVIQSIWKDGYQAGVGAMGTPNGWYFSGMVATQGQTAPSSLVYMPPDCSSYTFYRFDANPSDAAAVTVLSNDVMSAGDTSRIYAFNTHGVVYADIGLQLVSLYPFDDPTSDYAFTADSDLDSNFSQFSISVWCCKDVHIQSPNSAITMDFSPYQIAIALHGVDGSLRFSGTWSVPAPRNEYQVLFSIDTMTWATGWTQLPLNGGPEGRAYAVSADGKTVVGYVDPVPGDETSSHRNACYWTPSSGPVIISTNDFSEAYGVSGDGSVIVGATTVLVPTNVSHAFIWEMGDSGITPFGDTNDIPNAISADGSMIVGVTPVAGGGFQACFWDRSFTKTVIGFLPGHDNSSATAVSADGSYIVGYSSTRSDFWTTRAFRWTASGGMVDLGLASTATTSEANGVSNDGTVVSVELLKQDGSLHNKAAKWTSSGGLVQLPVLAGNVSTSINTVALGMSVDGTTIIGLSDYLFPDGTPANRSCLAWWTTDGITVLAPPFFGDLPDMWPTGVARDGSMIVGYTESSFIPWVYNRRQQNYTLYVNDVVPIGTPTWGAAGSIGWA